MSTALSGGSAAPSAVEKVAEDAPVPGDDVLREKWALLAEEYKSRPRLYTALSTAQLHMEDAEDRRLVCFEVYNEAQKQWLEENMLHRLEGRFQELAGSGRIRLQIHVASVERKEKVLYTPAEKARDMMDRNPQLVELVKDMKLEP